MARKYYTILIVPDATSRLRKIVIPRFLPKAALVAVALLAFGFAYLLDNYIGLEREYRREQQLKREAQVQKDKLSELRKQVQEMQGRMARLSEFGQKLRSIATLESSEELGKRAVGGPTESTTGEAENPLEKEKRSLLKKLEKEIDELNASSLSQEESFKELIEFFSKKADIILSTPSIWPVRGWVSSGYGYRTSPFTGRRQFHEGIDIATRFGKEVKATAAGVVTYARRKQGYGMMLEIDHGNGFLTRYAHNSKLLVKKGQRVTRGQVIAKVGNSGLSTGPHLHYEVYLKGAPVNPFKYIINEVADARR
jgi:murein DD-endopeptidase MepM/ murein hydrolase activator NlpD